MDSNLILLYIYLLYDINLTLFDLKKMFKCFN